MQIKTLKQASTISGEYDNLECLNEGVLVVCRALKIQCVWTTEGFK